MHESDPCFGHGHWSLVKGNIHTISIWWFGDLVSFHFISTPYGLFNEIQRERKKKRE